MPNKQKFIIIDGNALVHRAFHALPPLSTKDGKLVNAVYGFTAIFLRVLKELKPDYIAVTFDKKAPTFRHEAFEAYKANRIKQPQELYDQIPLIKKIVGAFHIPIFEKDGFEADDLIGTLSRRQDLKNKNIKTIIVTGDLDTLQLVDDDTEVYTLKRGIADTIVYDQKAVEERYEGLKPEQMIDFKALRGDPSDNIPGVKGIGEKGAVNLLKQFGTLENLYHSLEKEDDKSKKLTEKMRKLLKEHKEEAFLSKKLATIITDVPIEFNLDKCQTGDYDRQKLATLFQELEFKSLLTKLPEIKSKQPLNLFTREESQEIDKKLMDKKSKAHYELVDAPEKFKKFFSEISRQKFFAVDTETDNIDPFQAKLIGISFCMSLGKAFFVTAKKEFLEKLKPVLENEKIEKCGHNIKFDLEVLKESGVKLAGLVFDTMIASYLLNPGSRQHSLDRTVFSELGYEMMPIEALIGKKGKEQISLKEVPIEKVSWYSCEDADYTYRLVEPLTKQLEDKFNLGLLKKIEMPLVPVLAQVEKNGVKIDPKFLNKMSQDFFREIQKLTKKIHKMAGEEFNISSPVQLKEILFNKIKIPTDDIKKIKTGFSTAAEELEKMRDLHPIIDLISRYREYVKLKSTYLDALPQLINSKTGRVHTSFNQAVTATGRLSSSDPNLQNIPVRTEIGRKIRQAFIAEKGYKLLSIDYSQIELRIAASLANDQKMIDIFNKGEDIHRSTAAEINEVPMEKVTEEMRYAAKEVNFGVLYGMGVYGLAWRARITREKAKQFIEKYFTAFQGVKEYLEQTKALAKSLGYVETLFGRRRYLPEINSSIAQIRNAAERMAVNMPIQGTAADLIKLAMISVQKEISRLQGNEEEKIAKMILQVHDELVFEIQEDKIKSLARKFKEIMETTYKLKVPIEVEAKIGDNWGELKPLKI